MSASPGFQRLHVRFPKFRKVKSLRPPQGRPKGILKPRSPFVLGVHLALC